MENDHLKVGIIGIGMVGTPLARYFEEVRGYRRGKELFLYDINPTKGCNDDVNRAHIIFMCVPTPSAPDGSADLKALESAFSLLKGGKVVVVKSTVPPGTTEYFQKKYPRHKVLFNPEFLTERRAWEDLVNPDRQVVGPTDASKSAAATVLSLLPNAYFSSPGTLGTYTFLRMRATEAELGKYAGNLFGALKVTFGNVIKDFCDAAGALAKKKRMSGEVEYAHVRGMVGHDRRIGDSWLDVGHGGYRGYGGYCLVKDTKALIRYGEQALKSIPSKSATHKALAAGLTFLRAMRAYNTTLLEVQGLTEEDVSVHDHEWIDKKMSNVKAQMSNEIQSPK